MMKKQLLTALVALGASTMSWAEVNIYSYRQEFLIKPMLEAFTKESGIPVNIVYVKDGLADRLKQEGELSKADVVLTVDISRLEELVAAGVTQPFTSDVVNANIPPHLRGEHWAALTTRARAIYSSKERVGKLPASFTYQDLAKPELKGKVCVRSGKHPYNVSLVASMIARDGEAAAKAWLEGVKANLAQKPQGGDRDQVKAIMEGKCDYSLGNSYYFGAMLNNEKNPEQKEWAKAVEINFPNQESTGTHVNVSGVALAKHAPNRADALKLIEFLSGDAAQEMYAEVNHEYPVKAGVKRSDLVASWGDFKADDLNVLEIAKHYQSALKLIDEVKFDM